MLKRLTSVLLLASLAACSGGGGQSLNPVATKAGTSAGSSAVRHTKTITNTFSYTLGSASYPSGFSPSCGSNLIAYTPVGSNGGSTSFSFVAPDPRQIKIGPCHASGGDSITVTITSTYGEVKLWTLQDPGDFAVRDGGDDAGGTIAITDNTTGYSVTQGVWYSY